MVIGNGWGQISIYNSLSLSLVHSFQAHAGSNVNRIKQSPFNNLNHVATCSLDTSVKLWNISSFSSNWTLIRTYSQHLSDVSAIEWLNEDTLASSGKSEQTISNMVLEFGPN